MRRPSRGQESRAGNEFLRPCCSLSASAGFGFERDPGTERKTRFPGCALDQLGTNRLAPNQLAPNQLGTNQRGVKSQSGVRLRQKRAMSLAAFSRSVSEITSTGLCM